MADEQQKPRRKGKAIRAVVILAVIAVLAVAGWILAKTVIIPKLEDARVQSLIDEGDYEAAFALREEQRGAEAADALKREVAAHLIERNNFDAGYAILEALGDGEAIIADKYRRAEDLIERNYFDAAYTLLREVGDEEAVSADKRRRADALIAEGDFDAAYALLEEVGDEEAISADKYRRAEELIGAGDYVAAAALLKNLDGPDSAALLESIWEPYLADVLSAAAKAQPGDYITFGAYEQDNDPGNGKEPIEWLVLENEDGCLWLMSKNCLDCVQYNTVKTSVTWETCSLRAWLNGDFLNDAFSPAEQSRILTSTVSADPGDEEKTRPGRDTKDKVYLLSSLEVRELELAGAPNFKAVPTTTAYAVARGAKTYGNGSSSWWLRTPGAEQYMAAYYSHDGTCCGAFSSGDIVSWIYNAVRPVIRLDVGG